MVSALKSLFIVFMLILVVVSMVAGARPVIATHDKLLPAGQPQKQHGDIVASGGRSLRGFFLDNDTASSRRRIATDQTSTTGSGELEPRQLAGKFTLSPTSSPTVEGPRVYTRPENINSYHTDGTTTGREPCGLLGYSIFCPTTFQGVIGRFLGKYLD